MKTALVVDDSRSARMSLGKLLAEHGVSSDEAPSAEAALEYLEHKRPDVVFLDHMMPGMDGFETLSAIKTKPETAAIPVMMYTSQEGQLYLSQARALGAIGVLSKSMQPKDVKSVLRTLHLIDEPGPPPEIRREAPPPVTRQELTELMRELLYEHTTMLRREFRRQLEAAKATPEPPPPPAAAASVIGSVPLRIAAAANLLTLSAALALGYLYFAGQPPSDSAVADERGAGVVGHEKDGRTPSAAVEAAAGAQPPATGLPVAGGIEPMSRLPTAFEAAARPVDMSAPEVGPLFERLGDAGVGGTVLIDLHTGRYCMNYSPEGYLQLAPPEQPAASCEVIAEPMQGMGIAPEQAAAFQSIVASAARDGQLRVEAISHGSSRPLIDYPRLDDTVTAGDWNSVAASNQRVSLRLVEEPATRLAVN